MQQEEEFFYPELSYKIRGILFEIHNNLGHHRNEQQYGDAIELLLKAYKIQYKREVVLPRSFQGEKPGRNIVDFVVSNKIILEIKAKKKLTENDFTQVKRYLVSSNYKLGVLANFHSKLLSPKRVLNPHDSCLSKNFKVNS